MIRQKIDRVFELDIAIDVIDAAIDRCLSNTYNGFVDFERIELTRATILYSLSQYQLGNLGIIRLDKLGNNLIEMNFFEILEPLSKNQQEAYLENDDPFKRKLALDLANGLGWDRTFIERRKNHYRRIIDDLLLKLHKENIWEDGNDNFSSNTSQIIVNGNVINSNIIVGNENESIVNTTPQASENPDNTKK